MKIDYLTTFEKLGIAFDIGTLQIKKSKPKPRYKSRLYNEIIRRWCNDCWDKRFNGENWLCLVETEPEKAKRLVGFGEHPVTPVTLESLRWFDEALRPIYFTKFIGDSKYATEKEKEIVFKKLMRSYLEYMQTDKDPCSKLIPVLFNLIGFCNIDSLTNEVDWFHDRHRTNRAQGSWFLQKDHAQVEALVNKIEHLPLLEGNILEVKEFAIEQISLVVEEIQPSNPNYSTNPNIVGSILNQVKERVFLQYSPPIVQSLQLISAAEELEAAWALPHRRALVGN